MCINRQRGVREGTESDSLRECLPELNRFDRVHHRCHSNQSHCSFDRALFLLLLLLRQITPTFCMLWLLNPLHDTPSLLMRLLFFFWFLHFCVVCLGYRESERERATVVCDEKRWVMFVCEKSIWWERTICFV